MKDDDKRTLLVAVGVDESVSANLLLSRRSTGATKSLHWCCLSRPRKEWNYIYNPIVKKKEEIHPYFSHVDGK